MRNADFAKKSSQIRAFKVKWKAIHVILVDGLSFLWHNYILECLYSSLKFLLYYSYFWHHLFNQFVLFLCTIYCIHYLVPLILLPSFRMFVFPVYTLMIESLNFLFRSALSMEMLHYWVFFVPLYNCFLWDSILIFQPQHNFLFSIFFLIDMYP